MNGKAHPRLAKKASSPTQAADMKRIPVVGDLRVFWIPQVPGEPFYIDVGTVETGVMFMEILAKYDLFQFETRVKGDYSNAGGLEIYEENSDGKGNPGWNDWEDSDTGEGAEEYVARMNVKEAANDPSM